MVTKNKNKYYLEKWRKKVIDEFVQENKSTTKWISLDYIDLEIEDFLNEIKDLQSHTITAKDLLDIYRYEEKKFIILTNP